MNDKSWKIELLYFDGCPSWKEALLILNQGLTQLGITEDVVLKRVETLNEAVENEFIGSPTIRVDGKDLFQTDQTSFGLGCRIYQTPEGFMGWPTQKMITEKLLKVLGS